MKSKPILDWYREFPDEKIRQELIENYDPEWGNTPPFYRKENTLSEAIQCGFQWSKTTQNEGYWHKIYKKQWESEQGKSENQPTPLGGITDEMCITHLKNNGYKIFKEL